MPSGRTDDGGRHRPQLPEQVASYVRDLILSGEVRAGEFLRMEPIAEAIGVSNTPVREGLVLLRSEGFVELVPRRGFVVAPVSMQDIHDLFWAQAHIAAELAARAALKIDQAQVERLRTMDKKLNRAAEAGDLAGVAKWGHRFHREVNLATDSRRLTLLLGSVVHHLPGHFYALVEGNGAARVCHQELIVALRERDATGARDLTKRHILEGADIVLAMLEQRGLWAEHDAEA